MTKRAQMTRLVEEFNRSGLTQRAFCNQKQIIQSTFQYWYLKLKREHQQSSNFYPVDFDSDSTPGSIEVCYPNGITIRMNRFNLCYIKQLVSLSHV